MCIYLFISYIFCFLHLLFVDRPLTFLSLLCVDRSGDNYSLIYLIIPFISPLVYSPDSFICNYNFYFFFNLLLPISVHRSLSKRRASHCVARTLSDSNASGDVRRLTVPSSPRAGKTKARPEAK
jgi:hypothetical protein